MRPGGNPDLAELGKKHQFQKGHKFSTGPHKTGKHILTQALKELMNDDEKQKRLMDIIWQGAMKGNIMFVNLLFDRLEGKPLQKIEQTEKTDTVIVKFDDSDNNNDNNTTETPQESSTDSAE